MRHRFALFCQLQPQFLARLCFEIERLRNCRGAAHFAQQQNLQLEIAGVVFHLQEVARVDFARGLDFLSIAPDPAEFTGAGSERARFEESSGPEPFVDPHAALDVQPPLLRSAMWE